MNFILHECCWLHNKTIFLRNKSWIENHQFMSLADTVGFLHEHLLDERPCLRLIDVEILENVQRRVDVKFREYFKLKKQGAVIKSPRFVKCVDYNSFTCVQNYRIDFHTSTISIHGVGDLPAVFTEKIDPTMFTTCSILKNKGNIWRASLYKKP